MNNDIIDTVFKLSANKFVESINVSREINYDSVSGYTLVLILSDYPYIGGDKLKLTFHDVQELKLGDVNNLFDPLLKIEDVSDRQLENINFRVTELEYAMFGFWCKNFDYEIIN